MKVPGVHEWVVLTSVDVPLQMAGDAVARVAVLEVQAEPQQRRVLLHQGRDLHLDLVS